MIVPGPARRHVDFEAHLADSGIAPQPAFQARRALAFLSSPFRRRPETWRFPGSLLASSLRGAKATRQSIAPHMRMHGLLPPSLKLRRTRRSARNDADGNHRSTRDSG